MKNEHYNDIEEKIGYRFDNPDLLKQAFTRRSYTMEHGGENNEVLEFIGDKVLDFIVVKLLADKYGSFARDDYAYDGEGPDEFISEYREGELTDIKKNMTEGKTLAKCISDMRLEKYLIMGKGDLHRNIQNEDSVKEDLFEAILGAVALDCEWDTDNLENVVSNMLHPETKIGVKEDDYNGLIRQWSMKKNGRLPEIDIVCSDINTERSSLKKKNELRSFSVVGQTNGFVSATDIGKTVFRSTLNLGGLDVFFTGYGISIARAREDVCKLAYTYLKNHNLLMTMSDEIDEPTVEMAINQLEILARRGYFSLPTYEFFEEHDDDGNPLWECECHIKEVYFYFTQTASSKKEAKKLAAYEMLSHVLSD